MPNTATQDVQEQIFSTIRRGQEVTLDALKTWVESVQSVTARIPSVNMPFADQLPKASDLLASTYNFAEQMLSNQKKFADEVLEVTSPLLPGEDSKSAR